ncbi:MAG TPA: DnaD domain protein [Mollicutes bacterium]|nr:DnaD domain protein [Mollicutes bacterium]
MNVEKLIEIMKMKSINIPLYLIRNYKDLGLNELEMILMSIIMQEDSLIDYTKLSSYLNVSEQDVLLFINNLYEKGLLEIKVIKNDEGVMEEHVSIDNFYNKLALIMIGEESTQETNIYEVFEREFGRTLSSMEYEIISGWLESNYQEEVIIEALREAVYNGASNLRYIDKILHEWNKKGVKSVRDVRKEKERFAKSKKGSVEIPDYNWLEENE